MRWPFFHRAKLPTRRDNGLPISRSTEIAIASQTALATIRVAPYCSKQKGPSHNSQTLCSGSRGSRYSFSKARYYSTRNKNIFGCHLAKIIKSDIKNKKADRFLLSGLYTSKQSSYLSTRRFQIILKPYLFSCYFLDKNNLSNISLFEIIPNNLESSSITRSCLILLITILENAFKTASPS